MIPSLSLPDSYFKVSFSGSSGPDKVKKETHVLMRSLLTSTSNLYNVVRMFMQKMHKRNLILLNTFIEIRAMHLHKSVKQSVNDND